MLPTDDMILRPAESGDRDALLAVHAAAFGADDGPVIAQLVADLLDDDTSRPLLSLVARDEDRLVGHLLLTSIGLCGSDTGNVEARILCPLAVVPELQGRGIGDRLVRDGLDRLRDDGVGLVVVLGHPSYYPRFGFRPAGARGIDAPYAIAPENAEAWMVVELTPGALGRMRGTVVCARPLQDPRHWHE